MAKAVKAKRNYVNNAEFLEAMVKYKKAVREAEDSGEELPRIPNYIGECIYQIANRLAFRPNFINYSYRDDMVADGLENAIMCINNFDPEKSNNPFAYFTQIIYYAFLRRIMREKKQLYVKYKATEMYGILDEGEFLSDDDGANRQFQLYENISEFIYNFEEKKKKKKKSKTKGLEKFIEEIDKDK